MIKLLNFNQLSIVKLMQSKTTILACWQLSGKKITVTVYMLVTVIVTVQATVKD